MIKSFLTVGVVAAACGACYKSFPTDADEQRLQLRIEADSLPADGATLVHVVATIPTSARKDARTVSFTANGGMFVDGGAATASIIAIGGVADTHLRAPRTPGDVRVRAQLGSVIRDTTLQFDPAFPTRADVQPSSFAVKGSIANQISIAAYLRRTIGMPTPGLEIRFQAVRNDNEESIGQFGAAPPSDTNGLVTVPFTPGDTPYRGPVRIRAVTPGGRILGEAIINVIAPG